MKVVVAGGNGWLGRALCSSLAGDGHQVVVLSRQARPKLAARQWDGRTLGPWADEIDGADAVVNLAGESIAGGRWNPARRQVLIESRTQPTHALVAAIDRASRRPAVLVNQSAVGYYGDRGDATVTEADPPGGDFLARLVVDWEAAAKPAEALGVRVALIRTGVVMGPRGGALAQMA
ncbi:MAG TPA: NAD-dependent epimerase/dehydratase family protein, partial [Chloroflexota bacterium]